MAGSIVLVVTLLIALAAGLLLWRGARRIFGAAHVKHVSVSRQWLIAHQSDDHP
jgi:hypothetical protein